MTIRPELLLRYISMLLVLMVLSIQQGFSQRRGTIDDFENGTLEFRWRNQQSDRPPFIIWGTVTPGTYGLAEAEGVMKIDKLRAHSRELFYHLAVPKNKERTFINSYKGKIV